MTGALRSVTHARMAALRSCSEKNRLVPRRAATRERFDDEDGDFQPRSRGQVLALSRGLRTRAR